MRSRNFVRSLQEFWARLFGGTRDAAEPDSAEATAAVAPPRPFADYADPFATGEAERWSREELLRYSFQAFEAWRASAVVRGLRSKRPANLPTPSRDANGNWPAKSCRWPTCITCRPTPGAAAAP